MFNKIATLLCASLLLAACGQQQQTAHHQVAAMQFTNTYGEHITWNFDYDVQNNLKEIEKSIDQEIVSTQTFTWQMDHKLQEMQLIYAKENPRKGQLNVNKQYTWQNQQLLEVTDLYELEKRSLFSLTGRGFEIKSDIQKKEHYSYQNGILQNQRKTLDKQENYYFAGTTLFAGLNRNQNQKECTFNYDKNNILLQKSCTFEEQQRLDYKDGEKISTTLKIGKESISYIHDQQELLTSVSYQMVSETDITGQKQNKSGPQIVNQERFQSSSFSYLNFTENLESVQTSSKEDELSTKVRFLFEYDQQGRVIGIKGSDRSHLTIQYLKGEVQHMPLAFPKELKIQGLELFDLIGRASDAGFIEIL